MLFDVVIHKLPCYSKLFFELIWAKLSCSPS